jgi:hypothetical protein
MNVGYWGVPGTERVTIVHVQYHEQVTLCGYTMSDKYEFQWCAKTASAYMQRYIECKKCKEAFAQIIAKEIEGTQAKLDKRRRKIEKKKRNRATEARDMKEAAVVAHRYMNMARCVGGHVIAQGLMCPHCESYDPPRECHKERIKP